MPVSNNNEAPEIDRSLVELDPTPLLEDNQACIKQLGTNVFSNSRKSAHIDARYHQLRHEVVNTRSLRFVYVPTADQVADALTKPLPAPAVSRFHGAMAGTAPISTPDLTGPPGRIGLSVLRPDKFPDLRQV